MSVSHKCSWPCPLVFWRSAGPPSPPQLFSMHSLRPVIFDVPLSPSSPSPHTAPPRYTKQSPCVSFFPSSSMSSSCLWWPMCSTSVFSRFIFSPCLVNSPFHSSSVSCSSYLPHSPRRLHRGVSSWHPSSPSSCWWGPLLLWTAAGPARYPASIQSWHQTPPMLLLPPPLLLLFSRTCPQPSSLPLLSLPSTVASPSPSLSVLCQTLSTARSTYPRAILPCASNVFSTICLRTYIPSAALLPFPNLAVLPRSHLLLFSWSLRLNPSPTVSVLGWENNVKVPGMVLYCAVSSPLDRSKRFTLFLPWQTC